MSSFAAPSSLAAHPDRESLSDRSTIARSRAMVLITSSLRYDTPPPAFASWVEAPFRRRKVLRPSIIVDDMGELLSYRVTLAASPRASLTYTMVYVEVNVYSVTA